MGCGASADSGNKGKGYDPDKQAELPGKTKFIDSHGCVVLQQEERKQITALLVAFSPRGGSGPGLCLTYHNLKVNTLYALELTDGELEELKQQCNVTFGWSALFKSLHSELSKSKAKIATGPQETLVGFDITSVKDKTSQKMSFKLPLVASVGPDTLYRMLLEPLARGALARRRTEDREKEAREKEIKYSRLQTATAVMEAHAAKHKETTDRIMPTIVPLRQESAHFAKNSAELVSKIAAVERKIRKLQRGKERNALDSMYEEGGARPFQHLPQAEEHLPRPNHLAGDSSLDFIAARFPLQEGETVASLTKAPGDPRLVQLYEKAPRDVVDGVMQVFTRLDDWDYSVFDLERATDSNALLYTTYAILYKLDLVNHFKLDDTVLRRFLATMQAGYHPNPYHNATHAADVAQINYYIMVKGGLVERCKLSKEELLAGVLAGAIHDYDHPGFNNSFHTRTNAYLSTLYNDRSILENHHCACIYEMLRKKEYNIFADFTDAQRTEVRDTMVEMVLSTDMGNHGKIFQQFRRRLGDRPDWSEKKEDVRLALSISIKMADISNCGRPQQLYLEWAKNIASEFYVQGDAEAKLCIPISPYMDRQKEKQEFPKGQVSFMNFIVIPMFEAIAEFLPPVEFVLRHCTENKEYWQQLEA